MIQLLTFIFRSWQQIMLLPFEK